MVFHVKISFNTEPYEIHIFLCFQLFQSNQGFVLAPFPLFPPLLPILGLQGGPPGLPLHIGKGEQGGSCTLVCSNGVCTQMCTQCTNGQCTHSESLPGNILFILVNTNKKYVAINAFIVASFVLFTEPI